MTEGRAKGPSLTALQHKWRELTVLDRPLPGSGGSVQILSHIRSGDGFGLHDLRLIERPHVHVAFGGPCSAGDVAQPRGCQVEARLAVRGCSNDTGSAANLFHDPLERMSGKA